MQLSHTPQRVSVAFDDPNLVSCAGLAPVVALADRAGLADLVTDTLTLREPGGVNAAVKVTSLVAGMVAGADSIDDMALLRHGGMGRLFDGVRAPSTLGTFLRSFSFGHVRQLDAVAAAFLANLTRLAPVLSGSAMTYLDIDDTLSPTYGYAKQGAGYGYSGVKGLNALVGTLSSPTNPPVVAATRLRKGSANSARGAAKFLAGALSTARGCGIDPKRTSAVVLVRADSAYYCHDVAATARRHGARFSLTARMTPAVKKAIAAIEADAWTPIRYPNAIWDEEQQRLISDAEVAEVPFTAFTSRRKKDHISARLIVRRVKRLNPGTAPEQDELFTTWRYHAVFTDSQETMLEAEKTHRAHAVIETVHADLRAGALAHMPSGKFNANAAWLVLAAIAFNLTRATGALASVFHARATGATIRAHLINVPVRLARSARNLRLHLPAAWPWQAAWTGLWSAVTTPPPTAA